MLPDSIIMVFGNIFDEKKRHMLKTWKELRKISNRSNGIESPIRDQKSFDMYVDNTLHMF